MPMTWLVLGATGAAGLHGCNAVFGLEELQIGVADGGLDSSTPRDSTSDLDASDVADSGAEFDASMDGADVVLPDSNDHDVTDGVVLGVSGQQYMHRITKNGSVVDVKVDLSAAHFDALVPRADDTGFDVYPGAGKQDGTFAIPGVPGGSYYLRVGTDTANQYVVTNSRFVDFSYYMTGRADAVPAGPGTTLTFNVDGLNPWQPSDDLQLISTNAGVVIGGLAVHATDGAPAPGAMALSAMHYDYALAPIPVLVQADKGDDVLLTQLSTRTAGGSLSYQAIGRACTTSPLSFVSGTSNPVSCSLTAVPESQTLHSTWKHGDFAQYLPAINPSATFRSQLLVVDGNPGGLGHGLPLDPGAPDLLMYKGSQAMGDENLMLSYGNPFPSSFGLFAYAEYAAWVHVPLEIPEGGTAVYKAAARLTVTADVSMFNGALIEPTISPIRNPLVNGKDAFSALSGVTTTPTISWTAPTFGEPSYYQVFLQELFLNGQVPATRTQRFFSTKDTHIKIPPGILMAGRYYLVEIDAFAGSFDAESHPNIGVFPFGKAPAILGLFSP